MALFRYQALDLSGKTRKGVFEGDSERQVRQQLRKKKFLLISVSKHANFRKNREYIPLSKRMNIHEVILFSRQLSTLIQSGMPLDSSLKAITEQAARSGFKTTVAAIQSRVNEGYSLSESLVSFPETFSRLYRRMVAAGEKSGHLQIILDRLAVNTEYQQAIKDKVLLALIYPIILVVFSIAIIGILLASVVPKVVDQLFQTGHSLPVSTRILISASDFAAHWWWLICIIFLSLMATGKWVLSKENSRLAFDYIVLKVPIVSSMVRIVNTVRFARTLATCISSNIPILDAMETAGGVISNMFIRRKLEDAASRVKEGSSLRLALRETRLFPPIMMHMIESGEQSGELERMLISASKSLEKQFDTTINFLLELFTPLLTTIMAGLVLFIVVATLTPVLEMNSLMTQ